MNPTNAKGRQVQQIPADPLPWLATDKVTPPNRVAGYLHREELLDRILPTRRHTALLTAPHASPSV